MCAYVSVWKHVHICLHLYDTKVSLKRDGDVYTPIHTESSTST